MFFDWARSDLIALSAFSLACISLFYTIGINLWTHSHNKKQAELNVQLQQLAKYDIEDRMAAREVQRQEALKSLDARLTVVSSKQSSHTYLFVISNEGPSVAKNIDIDVPRYAQNFLGGVLEKTFPYPKLEQGRNIEIIFITHEVLDVSITLTWEDESGLRANVFEERIG